MGLLQAGWKGLFAIEKEANAYQSLHHNLVANKQRPRFNWPRWLPKAPIGINEVLDTYSEELATLRGKVDMVVGGPPCQGFSSAGRRDPNDPRNRLVEHYLSFVGIIRPKVVLIENVKGITADFDSDDTGTSVNYAEVIINELSNEYVVSSKVIDTSMFGVPQKRSRFFIVAVRKDQKKVANVDIFGLIEAQRPSFLFEKGIANVPVASKTAISDLAVAKNGTIESKETSGFLETKYKKPTTAYQKIMHGELGPNITNTRLARHRKEIEKRFSDIIKYCHANERLNISLPKEFKESLGLKKCAIRVLDPDNPSPTITSMPDDLLHYEEPRTLTVRENARLQSFPDWFDFRGKYTTGGDRRKQEVPRFTQVANAVPPLVSEAIGKTILTVFSSNKKPSSPLSEEPRLIA